VPEAIYRPAAEENFSKDRGGHEPELVIVHVMQGYARGTAARFADPASHVSAHYGIGVDGKLYLYVFEQYTAWHAGNRDYNQRSIGIELEGHIDDPDAFTGPMTETLVNLCADLCERYGIPPDRAHLIGHNEVPDPHQPGQFGGADHHVDPGRFFPWGTLISRLQAIA
jgi:N-acetyl-anhydromuramyl-L-alanine amidase AmpD